jgi:hypothetical protein
MNEDVAQQPLARALLRHLATTRGSDDPLASFAKTVLDGEASLRGAADFPWHSDALAAAATKAHDEQQRMTAEERARYERDAENLLHTGEVDASREQR